MANLSSTRIFGDGTVERSLYVKQRLGVGVGSPDYAVDVFGDIRLNANGSSNGKAQVRFNEGSGTNAYIGYDGNNLNGGDNRLEFNSNGTHMVIENRGRVGIGTTSPQHQLTVEGNNAVASLDGANTNGTPMLHIGEQGEYGIGFRWDSGRNLDIVQFDAETISNSGGTKVGHFRVRDEEFYWKGNVGIGTTSPEEALDVRGDKIQLVNSSTSGSSQIHFGDPDDVNVGRIKYEHSADSMEFETNAQGTQVTIDSGGTIQSAGIDIEGGDPGHINRDGAFYRTSGQAHITVDDKLYIRNQGGGGGETGQFLFNVDSGRFYLDGGGNIALSEDSSDGHLRVDNGSGSYREIEAQDYYVHEDNYWIGSLNLENHVNNDDAHHPDHRDSVEYIDFANNERSDYDGQDGKLYWDLSEGLYISSSSSRTGNTSVLQWSRSNVNPGSNISISYDGRGRPTISASGGNTYTDADASDISGSNTNKNIDGTGSGAPNARGYQVSWDTDFAFFGLVDLGDDNKHVAIANEQQSDDFKFYSAAANIVTITGGGTIRADGDVVAFYSSDRRLKKNPTQVENPMTKIEKLTGVGFGWKEKASREGKGFGVFAQDAKKIDDRLIRKQGDGYLGVDYQQLHGIEIEALKQVNEKVEENQSEIQRLKQRIAKLESNDNAI